MFFKNRKDAGLQLAKRLKILSLKNPIVIGLPRGGVVVAAIVAQELHCALDVIVPRKLGAPHNPELAIGALAGECLVLNEEIIETLEVSKEWIEAEKIRQQQEAARRLALFRKDKPPLDVRGKTVILVDDGIATGATMRASLAFMKKNSCLQCIIAIPIGPHDVIEEFLKAGEEVICLDAPLAFSAVGEFYEDFPQTEDREVIDLLSQKRQKN